jgi:sphingosine kinase
MVRTLKVYKGSHPVQLTLDDQGLRIEGDLNAAKKCK